MNKKRLILSLLVLMLVIGLVPVQPSFASGTIYYVSQSEGDDSNNGLSPASPWKTLTKASSIVLQPGDSILLKSGDIWTGETLLPKGSGTAANYILISSYGAGSRPHISPGIGVQIYGIRLVDIGGYKITNLEISNTYGGIVSFSNNTFDHDFLWIENCYFHDITGKDTAFYTHPDNNNPAPDLYFGAGIAIAGALSPNNKDRTFYSNITMINNTFVRCDSAIFTLPRSTLSNTQQITTDLTRNNFRNITIKNSTVSQSYMSGGILIIGTNKGLIDNVIIDETGYQVGLWWGIAALQISRSSNIVVTNSLMERTYRPNNSYDGEGFDFESDNSYITLRDSTIQNTEGPAILMHENYGAWPGNNSNNMIDNVTIRNVNSTNYYGNRVFLVSDNGYSSTGMIRNSTIYLRNNTQDFGIVSTNYVFEDTNTVYNMNNVQVYPPHSPVPVPSEPKYHTDDFSSETLSPGWSWIRENDQYWSLSSMPGFMRIGTLGTEIYQNDNTGNNLLLRNAPVNDFTIATKLQFHPDTHYNWQQAGLIVYGDDNNYIKLVKTYDSAGSHQLVGLKEVAAATSSISQSYGGTPYVYLKITKQGSTYTLYSSTNGTTWSQVTQFLNVNLGSSPKVGLIALGPKNASGDFDWFDMYGGKWEAEEGVMTGNTQSYADSEASGGVAVGYINTAGSSVEWTHLPAMSRLKVRYAANGNGQLSLYINGVHQQDVSFPSTGAWIGSYSNKFVNVNVPAGATIAFRYDSGDSPVNIDFITSE